MPWYEIRSTPKKTQDAVKEQGGLVLFNPE